MSFHENAGTGSQWNNLFERAVDDDPITMGVVWIIFRFLNAIFQSLL